MFRIYFSSLLKHREDYHIESDCETLEEAENVALFECRQALGSNRVMLLHRGDMVYDIRNGMELVGDVKIRSL